MLAQVRTATVKGVDAQPVRAEVNLSSGLPSFTVVGLPQGAVREGRERVSAALRNSGFGLPHRRITVNLAPADVRKAGTAFDLPIALGILAASGEVPASSLEPILVLGELGLDGSVRPVSGVLPIALLARSLGVEGIVVPGGNAREASMVSGLEVAAVGHLSEVVAHLRGETTISPVGPAPSLTGGHGVGPGDFSDVVGQETAKRVLEIAAAGGHNVLMVGPPGSGKSMLARRLPGILPGLTAPETLEIARVQSVAGVLREGDLPRARPFRAPHHSISYAGLAGGGAEVGPGEISLAHHGVLFLDELPEFRRNVLEMLRQPMEEGVVTLARASGVVTYPSRFLLVAAMNPCPCGRWGDGSNRCTCDPSVVARYRGRISGPLFDRVDLHVEVPAVSLEMLRRRDVGSSSEAMRRRVQAARACQERRFQGADDVFANAHMSSGMLAEHCTLGSGTSRLFGAAAERAGLTARGHDRTLRVARTAADLDGSDAIEERHVAEALQWRVPDSPTLGTHLGPS